MHFISLGSLENDNSNSIVENGFSEDDRVELWVDFVRVEDCQDSDRICRRQCCADGHGFDE